MAPRLAIAPYQETIVIALNAGLSQPRKQAGLFNALLDVIGGCAQAFGSTAEPATALALDGIYSNGLSEHLVQALKKIVTHIPGLRHSVRIKLLDLVAVVLSSKTFQEIATPVASGRRASVATMPDTPRAPNLHRRRSSSILVRARGRSLSPKRTSTVPTTQEDSSDLQILALDTLATFEFGAQPALLSYLQQNILEYLIVEDAAIRKAAIKACTSHLIVSGVLATPKHNSAAVQEIVQAILHSGVADSDPEVRLFAISGLDSNYDLYLVGLAYSDESSLH